MANPLSFPNLVQFVARLADRVTALERRRAAPVPDSLDDLDDTQILYGHSVSAPADGHVLTWDTAVSTRFGGAWVAAPSVAGDIAVTEALASYDNSEDATMAFDETSQGEWESPAFIVAPNSYQQVLVTIDVSVSDTVIGLFLNTDEVGRDVGFPTPWKATVYASDLPGVTYLGNGSGSCGITVPLWLRNETDTEATMSVSVDVAGVATSFTSDGYDGTVLVRAESVFQMAALTP